MIRAAMAVAAVTPMRRQRARQARDALFPRLVALILDTLFVGIVTSVATEVFGVSVVISGIPPGVPGSGVAFWMSQTAIPAIAATAIWLIYYAVCEAMFSATPGKALNGLAVVTVDGSPLRLWSIIVRNALRLVDVLPGAYLLGGLFTVGARNSQRIGDIAAATTVVFRREAIEPGAARSAGRNARLAFGAILLAAIIFTAGFDYFERPALVIEGLYSEHHLMDQGIVSYSLGEPTRTLDTITYPIKARTTGTSCTGWITLRWNGPFTGWQMEDGRLDCLPS